MSARRLRAVPDAQPTPERPDLHAYEAEQRRRIGQTDWSRLHIQGDRNAPLDLKDRPRSKGWTR